MKKTEKKAAKAEVYAVIANEKYGLYVGIVDEHDTVTRAVKAREVRHVVRYYSKAGGITALAVHGLCGPSASQSVIGAPAPSATLTGIVNVVACTPEARATFEAAQQR